MTDEIALLYISAEQQLLKKSALAKYVEIGGFRGATEHYCILPNNVW